MAYPALSADRRAGFVRFRWSGPDQKSLRRSVLLQVRFLNERMVAAPRSTARSGRERHENSQSVCA
ncbi:hypothetical protein ACLBR5_20190 [Escherichia coli]